MSDTADTDARAASGDSLRAPRDAEEAAQQAGASEGTTEADLRAAWEIVERCISAAQYLTVEPYCAQLDAALTELAAARRVVAAARRYRASWEETLQLRAAGEYHVTEAQLNERIRSRQALFDALALAQEG